MFNTPKQLLAIKVGISLIAIGIIFALLYTQTEFLNFTKASTLETRQSSQPEPNDINQAPQGVNKDTDGIGNPPDIEPEQAWEEADKNCAPTNSGASAHVCCPRSEYEVVSSLDACKTKCINTHPCDGITWLASEKRCFLRYKIDFDKCVKSTVWKSYKML